jgi:hypothetical protein
VDDRLVRQAKLTLEPQSGDRVRFLVRGHCMVPDFQDNDVVTATWKATQDPNDLAAGDVAIFLLQRDDGGASMLLKRWYGQVGYVSTYAHLYDNTGKPMILAPDHLYLLATDVRLAQRPVERGHEILAGVVLAGLDLGFQEDVARILASTHETMVTSTNAIPTLDPDLAAAYQRGFADALRAVAVAFGVAIPCRLPTSTQATGSQYHHVPSQSPRGQRRR